MSYTFPTRDGLKNTIFCSIHSNKFAVKFSWPIRWDKCEHVFRGGKCDYHGNTDGPMFTK